MEIFIQKPIVVGKLGLLSGLKGLTVKPFSAGTVCRRYILTSTDGPRTERIPIFIMAVDP